MTFSMFQTYPKTNTYGKTSHSRKDWGQLTIYPDYDEQCVYVTCNLATVSADTINKWRRFIAQHPDTLGFDYIVDVRNPNEGRVSLQAATSLGQYMDSLFRTHSIQGVRVAVVASDTFLVRVVRQYQCSVDSFHQNISIFRSKRDALSWIMAEGTFQFGI